MSPEPQSVIECCFKFTAKRSDEMSMMPGDRPRVLETCSDGWTRGQLGPNSGWFPSAYVRTVGTGRPGMVKQSSAPPLPTRSISLQAQSRRQSVGPQSYEDVQLQPLPAGPVAAVGVAPVAWAEGSDHTKLPWYHGKLPRSMAEDMLSTAGQGTFLVRDSERTKGDYTLTVMAGRPTHVKVAFVTHKKQYQVSDRSFNTLVDVVRHFRVNAIVSRPGQQPVRLVAPYNPGTANKDYHHVW